MQGSPWADLLSDRSQLSIPTARPTEADVALVQEFFTSPLPTHWVSWVRECGSLAGLGRSLLGLRPRVDGAQPADGDQEDSLDILMLLRLTEPTFPRDLLPIELLPERQLHCVRVGSPNRSPVVLIDLDRPDLQVDSAWTVVDFIYDWRNDLHAMSAVVEEAASVDNQSERVLLRPDEWSTRRLCSQNVIVGLLQTRHNRDTNEHDVAVFTTATLRHSRPAPLPGGRSRRSSPRLTRLAAALPSTSSAAVAGTGNSTHSEQPERGSASPRPLCDGRRTTA